MWGSSSPSSLGHSSSACPRSSTGCSAGSTPATAGAPSGMFAHSAKLSRSATRRKLRAAWISFFWSLAHAVWWIGLAAGLVYVLATCSGCRPRVEYLDDEARVVHLEAGEPAPWEGWLLTASNLADLYEGARFHLLEEEEGGEEDGEPRGRKERGEVGRPAPSAGPTSGRDGPG